VFGSPIHSHPKPGAKLTGPCARTTTTWAKWYDLSDVRAACKREANEMAKYGTPEWRDRYVAMYHTGADGLAGTAKLIEPDVKFQNRFGAI
jgi:hypothetical protein